MFLSTTQLLLLLISNGGGRGGGGEGSFGSLCLLSFFFRGEILQKVFKASIVIEIKK